MVVGWNSSLSSFAVPDTLGCRSRHILKPRAPGRLFMGG